MTVTRRAAVADDAEFVRRTHHLGYRGVVERQFGSWDEAQQDRFFASEWAHGGIEIVLLDGRPCGFVCIEDCADDIVVRQLVVAPEFQGRGIGTAILRETMERARGRGVPVLIGGLNENRALDLYRRLGFRDTDRTELFTGLEWRPPPS